MLAEAASVLCCGCHSDIDGVMTGCVQNRDDPYSHAENFGIWALRWSSDGRELLAGTGNDSLYTYDAATSQVRPLTALVPVHGWRGRLPNNFPNAADLPK